MKTSRTSHPGPLGSTGRARALLAVIAFALSLAPQTAKAYPAAEIAGVEFAARHDASGNDLVLNGIGLLRYKVVFKGYVAGLYLGCDAEPASLLGDVPKRLEIEYFWSIGAKDFAKVTLEGITKNLAPEEVEALRPRIEEFNGLYQDIEPGDRYALTYAPGRGTELARNGNSLGVVPGADFGSALFSIWFGSEPFSESLKQDLLVGDSAWKAASCT